MSRVRRNRRLHERREDHWNVCDRHKTCWPIGANLFSCWEEERQEDWDRNAEKLSGYHRVEPLKMAG